eukprot:CAMPEP_0198201512 /NCGR_PEP_ID=MMETSP1445-20131203/4403_1 /TAXON_ID=36898 /ORGANISM="Pyramimonas sp., Strain CCMP2087" /LENGTH=439 /DNA_ID=CAMNT_0043871911 /DNA_START=12 /DNA_END=1331 /DNA_ORIENTATION=-
MWKAAVIVLLAVVPFVPSLEFAGRTEKLWSEVQWRTTRQLATSFPVPETTDPEKRARLLMSKFPFVDAHSDVPMQLRLQFNGNVHKMAENGPVKTQGTYIDGVHVDLHKLKEGRMGMQVWAAWVPPETADLDAVSLGMQQVEITRAAIEAHPSVLHLALTAHDVDAAFYQGKVGIMVGVEGGYAIGNNLELLRVYYRLGVRIFTLTHSKSLPWASACTDSPWTPGVAGMTPFGRRVVAECNRLGIVIDLSHASVASMHDTLSASKAPVVWSHSNAMALCNDARNVPDDILARVRDNGGMVMVTLPERFLVLAPSVGAMNYTTVDDVVRHINYLVEQVGVDYVGFGSDYDGCTSVPHGLDHAGLLPNLVTALIRTGRYTDADLAKITGGNFLRVWREVERISQSWGTAPVFGNDVSVYSSADSNMEAPACHYQWQSNGMK